MQPSSKGTPDQIIAKKAKVWRQHDQDAIANKGDDTKQRAEYHARRDLAKTIDDVKER